MSIRAYMQLAWVMKVDPIVLRDRPDLRKDFVQTFVTNKHRAGRLLKLKYATKRYNASQEGRLLALAG